MEAVEDLGANAVAEGEDIGGGGVVAVDEGEGVAGGDGGGAVG